MCNDNNSSTNLAKVLWYYNLIYDTHSVKQKITCPFHPDDINPSMLINLSEGTWFCFGCQSSGDAMKFVNLMEKKYNGMNDLQSCKKYFEILRSEKCSDIYISNKINLKNKKQSRQLYNEAYDYYHGLSRVDWYCPEGKEVIEALEYMEFRGYSKKTLKLANAKVTYNNSYGIIFPMIENRKFRGWVSRTMREDIEKKRKYLYNEGFSRSDTLVGSYGTKDYIIVVEGYMDRLRFVENGMSDNVVAILGWKMSKQQELKIRKAGIKNIISCLDNDECGNKGTLYLKSVFGPGNVLRWSYINGLKDPGEMTHEQFHEAYKKTMKKYNEKYS